MTSFEFKEVLDTLKKSAGCSTESNEQKQIYNKLKLHVKDLKAVVKTEAIALSIEMSDELQVIQNIMTELDTLQKVAAFMPDIKNDVNECYKMLNDPVLEILNDIKSTYDLSKIQLYKIRLPHAYNTLQFLIKCKAIKWSWGGKINVEEKKQDEVVNVLSNKYVNDINKNVQQYLIKYGDYLENTLHNSFSNLEVKGDDTKCDLNNAKYVNSVQTTINKLNHCLREFRDISKFDGIKMQMEDDEHKQGKQLKLVPFLFLNHDIQLSVDDYINSTISMHKQDILINMNMWNHHQPEKLPILRFVCLSMGALDRFISNKDGDVTYYRMATQINYVLKKTESGNEMTQQIINLCANSWACASLKEFLDTLKKSAGANKKDIKKKRSYGEAVMQLFPCLNKLMDETKSKFFEINEDNTINDAKVTALNKALKHVANLVETISPHLSSSEKAKAKKEETQLGLLLFDRFRKLMKAAIQSARQKEYKKCEKRLDNIATLMEFNTQFYVCAALGSKNSNQIASEYNKMKAEITHELEKVLRSVKDMNKCLKNKDCHSPYTKLRLNTLHEQFTNSRNQEFNKLWYNISDEIVNSIQSVLNEVKEGNNTFEQETLLRKVEISLLLFPREMKNTISIMLSDAKKSAKINYKNRKKDNININNNFSNLLMKWNLSEYISVLITEQGYEEIEDVYEITLNDLKEIGLKPGHARKLKRKINEFMNEKKNIKKLEPESKEEYDIYQSEEDTNNTIRNACVICIAIEKYDNNDKYQSLPSVRDDVENYKAVLGRKYHYKVFSSLDEYKNGRMTQADVFKFINKCKKQILVENDYEYETDYDGMIVSLSGHGTSHSFVCSDGKQIKYSKLRSRFATTQVLEDLPRIFCVDACRVFDDSLARSGNVNDSGNLSVTIMGNTEGDIVTGGKVSEYINKHFNMNANSKLSASKWCNFGQILENATVDIKKETEQRLILTECDMGVNRLIFKPNNEARGHKYDSEYMNEKWEIWVKKNGNVNVFKETQIKCNYNKKQIELDVGNDKKPLIVKKNTFKIRVNKGTVYIESLSDSSVIEIKCMDKKPAKYWCDTMKRLASK